MKPKLIIALCLAVLLAAAIWIPHLFTPADSGAPGLKNAYLVNEEIGVRYSYQSVVDGTAPLTNLEPAGGGMFYATLTERDNRDAELTLVYE